MVDTTCSGAFLDRPALRFHDGAIDYRQAAARTWPPRRALLQRALAILAVTALVALAPTEAGLTKTYTEAKTTLQSAAVPTRAERQEIARVPDATAPPAKLLSQIESGRYDRLMVWIAILLATALGALAALYPIIFYIRKVWTSRQQLIFDTLSDQAKACYIELYHNSDKGAASSGGAPGSVARSFEQIYNKWFGRSRLIVPAMLVSAFTLVYVLLAVVAGAQALFSKALVGVAFEVPGVALGAIAGAYVLVSTDTIARVTRRDLLPDDLYLTTLRLAACVPLGYAFATLAKPEVAPFVALALTAFPIARTADFLREIVTRQVGVGAAAAAPSVDAPSRLAGVDSTVCERLSAIGVNTITQLAYSDPVQLTMRTSLNFLFVLDIVSQSLAWIYLEQKLDVLRPMGLRGSFELAALQADAARAETACDSCAKIVIAQIPGAIGLSAEQFAYALHQIADDPYTGFLLVAYAPPPGGC